MRPIQFGLPRSFAPAEISRSEDKDSTCVRFRFTGWHESLLKEGGILLGVRRDSLEKLEFLQYSPGALGDSAQGVICNVDWQPSFLGH